MNLVYSYIWVTQLSYEWRYMVEVYLSVLVYMVQVYLWRYIYPYNMSHRFSLSYLYIMYEYPQGPEKTI